MKWIETLNSNNVMSETPSPGQRVPSKHEEKVCYLNNDPPGCW